MQITELVLKELRINMAKADVNVKIHSLLINMYREIFGDKSGQVVRRLDDSDEEEEPARKKLAISSTAKPTDIFAEVCGLSFD